jgi:hypothetical protein
MKIKRRMIQFAACSILLFGVQRASLAQNGTARTGCNSASAPGAEEVIIYADGSFTGDCRILSVGVYPTSGNFGLGNDTISSLKVGSNVQAQLFWDGPFAVPNTPTGFLDYILPISWNAPDLWNYHNFAQNYQDWNDKTSSIRVIRRSENCANPGPRQVVFFQHTNYQGDCVTKNVGVFDVWDIGMQNDSISSLKVGSQVNLLICTDAGFGGRCDSYRPGVWQPDLGGTPVGSDTISSAYAF